MYVLQASAVWVNMGLSHFENKQHMVIIFSETNIHLMVIYHVFLSIKISAIAKQQVTWRMYQLCLFLVVSRWATQSLAMVRFRERTVRATWKTDCADVSSTSSWTPARSGKPSENSHGNSFFKLSRSCWSQYRYFIDHCISFGVLKFWCVFTYESCLMFLSYIYY